MIYIDADNTVYGRISTYIAKKLLEGEGVTIVNASGVVITGSRKFIINRFKERREIGSVRKGPYYPRTPAAILRRSIKNMIPSKKTTGKEALRRCFVYSGIPAFLKDQKFESLDIAKNQKMDGFVRLREISEILGVKA